MKSESEAALTGDTVPPYLRAYGSTYRSGRYGQQYQPIGHAGDGEQQQQQAEGSTGGAGPGGLFVLRRALGALAVFVGFAVAVSSTSAKWPSGEWGSAVPGQGLKGVTYREMFEVSLGTVCSVSSRMTYILARVMHSRVRLRELLVYSIYNR